MVFGDHGKGSFIFRVSCGSALSYGLNRRNKEWLNFSSLNIKFPDVPVIRSALSIQLEALFPLSMSSGIAIILWIFVYAHLSNNLGYLTWWRLDFLNCRTRGLVLSFSIYRLNVSNLLHQVRMERFLFLTMKKKRFISHLLQHCKVNFWWCRSSVSCAWVNIASCLGGSVG